MNNSPSSSLPRRLLVGVDYSPESANAAQYALYIARATGALVHLFHAWAAPYASTQAGEHSDVRNHDLLALMRQSAEENMERFVASLEVGGVLVSAQVESGDPKALLLRHCADHEGTWLVLGKRTHSSLAEWFLGNVATYVVRHCQAPVLVVPREATS